ncbi:hypothetical protein F6P94_01820 [Escherichia coli]|nr:hypothetical protein F6P94_01820 [Escherichia coli]
MTTVEGCCIGGVTAKRRTTERFIGIYLTDSLDPNELERGFNEGVFTAAKLYPTERNLTFQRPRDDAISLILAVANAMECSLLVHGDCRYLTF